MLRRGLEHRGHALAVKRFDRAGPTRVHALSANVALKAAGVGLGYPELAQLLRRRGPLQHNTAAQHMQELFRRMVFNILIDHTDDHEKNHVLLMSDRVDEWALSFLNEFDGTPMQSVAKGAVDLGKLQDEEEKKAAEQAETEFKPVLDRLKEALKDKATDVRATSRLVDSPACLVVQDGGMSMQLARMLKAAGQAAPSIKPILEVNASHPLVKKLEASEASFEDYAHILFDQALLAEGGLPEDPAAYVRRVNALLA